MESQKSPGLVSWGVVSVDGMRETFSEGAYTLDEAATAAAEAIMEAGLDPTVPFRLTLVATVIERPGIARSYHELRSFGWWRATSVEPMRVALAPWHAVDAAQAAMDVRQTMVVTDDITIDDRELTTSEREERRGWLQSVGVFGVPEGSAQ